MKLNYRDKVILGVLLAMIIAIGGFVGLIKPKTEDIKTDQATLAEKEKERDAVQEKIDMIEPLKTEIEDTYKDTNKLVADFIPMEEILETYKLDQFMRDTAEECEVKINTLNVSDLSGETLDYYYSEYEQVAGGLFSAADINGSQQAAFDELTAEQSSLSQRTREEVMGANYAVNVTGTKENIWKYMQALEDFGDARIINSVGFSDYTFGGDEDKREAGDDGERAVDFVMTFYSVYEMDKPNTDAD